LWRAGFTPETDLELSDLQGADITTPMTDDEKTALRSALDAIPEGETKADGEKRLGGLLAAGQPSGRLRFTASAERQVLVSLPKNPLFAAINRDWLIARPTPPYTTAFVALLADELAAGGPDIAGGIARRVAGEIREGNKADWRRSLYAALACRLLANAAAGKVKLEQPSIDRLSGALRDKRIECEPAKPAALH